MRTFTKFGSTLSVARQVCYTGYVSVLDTMVITSSLSVRAFSKLGVPPSVYDYSWIGSSISVRSFLRMGSSVSVKGNILTPFNTPGAIFFNNEYNYLQYIDDSSSREIFLGGFPYYARRELIARLSCSFVEQWNSTTIPWTYVAARLS